MLTQSEVLIIKSLGQAPTQGFTTADIQKEIKEKVSISVVRNILLKACKTGLVRKYDIELQGNKHMYSIMHYSLTPLGYKLLAAINSAEKAFRRSILEGSYGEAVEKIFDNNPWFN